VEGSHLQHLGLWGEALQLHEEAEETHLHKRTHNSTKTLNFHCLKTEDNLSHRQQHYRKWPQPVLKIIVQIAKAI